MAMLNNHMVIYPDTQYSWEEHVTVDVTVDAMALSRHAGSPI